MKTTHILDVIHIQLSNTTHIFVIKIISYFIKMHKECCTLFRNEINHEKKIIHENICICYAKLYIKILFWEYSFVLFYSVSFIQLIMHTLFFEIMF